MAAVEQIATGEKVWYTVKDLSTEWGISEGWIRDHATRKQPRIKGRKFGKFIKFHKTDIETFLNKIATVKDHDA
jgi:Helix-turn-helix domain